MITNDHAIAAKHVGDFIFGGVTLAALLSWLPHLTAIMAFAWWTIRIYETDTVQKWLGRKGD